MLAAVLTAIFAGAVPQAGAVAPDFTVTDTEGNTLVLSELVKEGPVILAFFPKAFTPGCTKELTAYTNRYADIENREGRVIAVSTDDVETLKRFRASLKAPFTFVSDEEGKLVRMFDVKTPVVTFAKRYTFVIGEGRKILSVTSGSDAVDISAAVNACPMRQADAGTR